MCRQARDRLDELRLAVPVDAGDADDLAGRDLERDPADSLEAALVVHAQVLDGEERLTRLGGLLVDAQEHLAADHEAGESFLGRALAGDGLDRLPAPEDGDAVGDLEHLAELVGDEDDRLPLGLQRADDARTAPAPPAA